LIRIDRVKKKKETLESWLHHSFTYTLNVLKKGELTSEAFKTLEKEF